MPRRSKGLAELAGTGDDGSTGLLGGGRIPKDDLRVEAYGTVDEASSAIGLAKALSSDAGVHALCEELQRGLYRIGAELATNPEHTGRFARTEPADVDRLEAAMTELEDETPMPSEFVLPGATPASAALDLARAVARRAERLAVSLLHQHSELNPETVRYLNRLSLLLFVLARHSEALEGTAARPARSPGPRARA